MESKSPSAGKRYKRQTHSRGGIFYGPNSSALWTYFDRVSPQNNLCESTVSRIFTTWINLLYFHLKELCQMPDYCDELGKAEQFSKFPDLKVIVDCTEIFTQKPSSLKANWEI